MTLLVKFKQISYKIKPYLPLCGADEWLLSGVEALVGLELAGLGEGAQAAGVVALVRLLARVRPHVSLTKGNIWLNGPSLSLTF